MKIAKWISDRLYTLSTGWVVLAALVIFVAFTILVLPRQTASAEAGSGDAGSPDTSFTYTTNDLYRLAEAYGESGRQAYVRARFTFDLIWPVVYTAFLGTAISWLFRRAVVQGSRWQRVTRYANLAPLLGMAFDYLENTATSLVMLRYPARTAVVDVMAPLFTTVKWAFVGGSFVVLLVGAAICVWQWARDRGSGGNHVGSRSERI
ncbi:MAG: hypothetical protein JXM73_19730 [Anaerolineae bacterium]|nr:hypothetical protein [Anaerolineae bacterium]